MLCTRGFESHPCRFFFAASLLSHFLFLPSLCLLFHFIFNNSDYRKRCGLGGDDYPITRQRSLCVSIGNHPQRHAVCRVDLPSSPAGLYTFTFFKNFLFLSKNLTRIVLVSDSSLFLPCIVIPLSPSTVTVLPSLHLKLFLFPSLHPLKLFSFFLSSSPRLSSSAVSRGIHRVQTNSSPTLLISRRS